MFFGLTNSPATFQTIMDMIFHKQIMHRTLTVYMDDIAVHTKRKPNELEEQHLERHKELIREMLTILCKHDLYLNIEKCQFEQKRGQLPGSACRGKMHQHERSQGWESQRLEATTKCNRSVTLLGIHGVLSLLYQRVLINSMTPPRPNEEDHLLALGRWPSESLWRTQNQDVQLTDLNEPWPIKNVLPSDWCIFDRSRSGTNSRSWRIQETQTGCLLLMHLLASRIKLWHLWKGILSGHQGDWKLEGPPHMDRKALHHWNRPQEPDILEGTQEVDRKDCVMAWKALGLQLQNRAHCRQE